MLRSLLLLLLLSCSFYLHEASAQDVQEEEVWYLHPSFFGSKYYVDGVKQSHQDVQRLLKPFPQELKLYKKGYARRNFGNGLHIAGWVGLLGMRLGVDKDKVWDDFSTLERSVFIGSSAAIISGVFIAASGESKVIWSYKSAMFKNIEAYDPGAEVYAVYKGRLYDAKKQRLSWEDMRGVLSKSSKALKYFDRSKRQRRISYGLLGLSGAGLGVMFATIDYDADFSTGPVLPQIGLGTFLGSFLAGGIVAAVSDYSLLKSFQNYQMDGNHLVGGPSSGDYDIRMSLGTTNNGVGLVVNF